MTTQLSLSNLALPNHLWFNEKYTHTFYIFISIVGILTIYLRMHGISIKASCHKLGNILVAIWSILDLR